MTDRAVHPETGWLAAALLEDAALVEFRDRSPLAGDTAWATLADMADPGRAGNNCHLATHACFKHVTEQVGVLADQDLHTVEVVFTDGCHWFLALTCADGTRWALDPTIRQFDPTGPALAVAPLDAHVARVGRLVLDGHGDRVVAVELDGLPLASSQPVAA